MTTSAATRRRPSRTAVALSVLAMISVGSTAVGTAASAAVKPKPRSPVSFLSTSTVQPVKTVAITFPGRNGSAWPAQYADRGWASGGATRSSTQQSAQGYLTVAGGGTKGSAAVTKYAPLPTPSTHGVDYVGKLTVPASNDSYANVYLATDADSSRHLGLQLDPWGARLTGRSANGGIYGNYTSRPTAGSTVTVRIRRAGNVLMARWWSGTVEPTSWQLRHDAYGDPSLTGLPGYGYGLGTGGSSTTLQLRVGAASMALSTAPSTAVVTPTTTAPVAPTASPTTVPIKAAPANTTATPQPSTAAPVPPTSLPAPSAAALPTVFPQAKAFWDPIRNAPRLDTGSSAISAMLAEAGRPRVALLYRYGSPIVEADASTPRYALNVRYQGTGPGQWGFNDLALGTVPIPDGALPSTGTDGKMTIIDRSTRKVYDLWQMERSGSSWTVSWGGVYPLDGDGSSRNAAYGSGAFGVSWPNPVSRGTGSGIATYLGTVRMAEIEAGHIPHAVGITSDMVCGPAQTGNFRWPATTTDGTITSGTCVPEGARVQLDPSINLAAIPGITKGELALGRALQTYGGIVNDIGGSRMSFYFEKPQPGQVDPYPAAGLTGDYYGFNKLPWNSLRVLAAWDGA